MNSPVMKMVGTAVWLITALGAVHVGLGALGYNLLAHPVLMGLARPVEYLVGAAGVVSLVLFVMHSGCCWCGCGYKNGH